MATWLTAPQYDPGPNVERANAIAKTAEPVRTQICGGCLSAPPTRLPRQDIWTVGHAIAAGLRENA